MNNGKLQLNAEYPPPDESADIQKMVELIRAIHHPQRDGRVLRAQHAKDTGCVQAQFIVGPDLPDEYRYGVFREARTYDAIIRFSNASEFAESDAAGTPRGMAIKILHVDGERAIEGDGESSQDFLLVDSPAFIFRAVKDYTALFALRVRFKNDLLALLTYLLTLHGPQTARILKAKFNRIKGSLIRQYWSMSPFRLGPRAVKFTAKPGTSNAQSSPVQGPRDAENFLFQALAGHLKGNVASFDFMVQFQKDPLRMPIEDASVEWKESDSPFRKVATVSIPAQDLGSGEMRAFRASCENLSFNPWHALADHRPLGGLNRLRRAAYEVSVQHRLKTLS